MERFIKRGEHGALMVHKDWIFSVPALPLEEVYDPTGAGDCFAGAFAGYLAKTGKLDSVLAGYRADPRTAPPAQRR